MVEHTPYLELKHGIQQTHIEQLRSLPSSLVAANPDGSPLPISDDGEVVFPARGKGKDEITEKDIEQWYDKNKKDVDKAIEAGGISGRPISWQVAFLTFLEACATYLRDDQKVWQAIQAAARRRPDHEVRSLLSQAQERIDKVAKHMGLQFVTACDFVQQHPDGHLFWCGAFGGIFFRAGAGVKVPFIGLAFKGTTTAAEWATNAAYGPTTAPSPVLYGTQVHHGWYTGMFGKFGNETPFATLLNAILRVMTELPKNTVLHATGHSLGGAYATLAFAEIARKATEVPHPYNWQTRELWTFGSPRVGLYDFASKVVGALAVDQTSWRIVNKEDSVTRIPPVLGLYDYIHLDEAINIFPDKAPAPMDSEIKHGRHLKHGNASDHGPAAYHDSLRKSLQSGA